MLRCDFKGIPSEFFVTQNLYHVINDRLPHQILTSSNWEDAARPGIKLKMSMILSHFFARKGRCPRCNCNSFQDSHSELQGMMTW
jgi:hypothetical protein